MSTVSTTYHYNMDDFNWKEAEVVGIEYLLANGNTLLHLAAHSDDAEIAQQIIDHGCDVDALTGDGITPLMHAVQMKSSLVIKVLLAANADIFLRGQCKRSPAQAVLASDSRQNEDTIFAFLERIRKDASGDSVTMAKALLDADCPLPRALFLKNVKTTRYMLEHGSWVDDVDQVDNTALHHAVRAMDWEHVELLTKWGAKVRAVNIDKQTPLHLYGIGNDSGHKVLRALLEKSAPLYDQDVFGIMAITRIVGRKDSETVRTLLMYGVDLIATHADGTTLLHHAAYNENPGVIKQFQGRNFDVNAVDVNGQTPLWYTLDAATSESLKFLLDNGADLNILDSDRYTAFFQGFYLFVGMKSRVEDCLRCIELFLQYGAGVDCVDASGETIFDYALACNSFVLTRPILEYVAMRKAIGKPVAKNEIFLSKIDLHEKFRNHFEFCRRKIEKMKRVVIFEKVTLFKFLKDDDRKLEKYARNPELVERLKRVVYSLRHSNLYFDKILRRRVEKAIKTAELRKAAALRLLTIEGNNDHIVENILRFIDDDDLRNVSLI